MGIGIRPRNTTRVSLCADRCIQKERLLQNQSDDLNTVMKEAGQAQIVLFTVRDEYVALHELVFARGLTLLLRMLRLKRPPDYNMVASRAGALLATLEPALAATERLSEFGITTAQSMVQYGQALQSALIGLSQLMLETSILGGTDKVSRSTLMIYQMAVTDLDTIGKSLNQRQHPAPEV